MIRVFVVYEQEPTPERYAAHVELCRRVPGTTFRHGKVVRTLFGHELHYYAEFEFPDLAAFQAASAGDEFRATGKDAAEMGYPHSVYVADIE
jgi:hypothetical protein